MKTSLGTTIALAMLLLSGIAWAQAPIPGLRENLVFCVNTDTPDSPIKFGGCGTGAGEEAKLRVTADGKKLAGDGDPNEYPDVRTAIIVFHAAGKNGTEHYRYLAARTTAADSASVWLVAPHFQTRDGEGNSPSDNYFRWDLGEWSYKIGEPSNWPEDAYISSFKVVEELIRRMRYRANGITDIVLIGHSAGGKFVDRFSAATRIETESAFADKYFSYVVASPSSYIYLSNARYKSNEDGTTISSLAANEYSFCNGIADNDPVGEIQEDHYNHYPYGPLHPAGNVGEDILQGTPAELRARLHFKRRLFLIGTLDDAEPDNYCGEMIQAMTYPDQNGEQIGTRYSAAVLHDHHLNTLDNLEYPGQAKFWKFCKIVDVGHSGELMLNNQTVEDYWRTPRTPTADFECQDD